jgi:hypothetical protein
MGGCTPRHSTPRRVSVTNILCPMHVLAWGAAGWFAAQLAACSPAWHPGVCSRWCRSCTKHSSVQHTQQRPVPLLPAKQHVGPSPLLCIMAPAPRATRHVQPCSAQRLRMCAVPAWFHCTSPRTQDTQVLTPLAQPLVPGLHHTCPWTAPAWLVARLSSTAQTCRPQESSQQPRRGLCVSTQHSTGCTRVYACAPYKHHCCDEIRWCPLSMLGGCARPRS